jgi:hypothetical protein
LRLGIKMKTMTKSKSQVLKEEWEKGFDKLLTECFSGNIQKLKYFTWKYKEHALKSFIEQALTQAVKDRLSFLEDDAHRNSVAGDMAMHDRRMLEFYSLKKEAKDFEDLRKERSLTPKQRGIIE